MMARGSIAAGSVLLGSLAQLAVPLTALLTLGARPFGQFSVVYLMFAWGLSLQLSICSEPFVRDRIAHGPSLEQRQAFRAASAVVGCTLGLATGLLAAVFWPWPLAATTAVAVAAGIIRIGTRFQAVVERGMVGAMRGDAAFIVGFAAAVPALRGHVDDLTLVLAAWAVAATASVLLGPRSGLPRPSVARRWSRDHAHSIRPLLKESLVLDASAIGGAYLLLPILSVVEFGIYRAVSNVATPARLVTDAVRPLMGRALSPVHQRLLLVGVLVLGATSAVVTGLAILAIDREGLDLGVVSDLGPYAAQTGAYLGASIVGAIFYFQARAHADAQKLWTGRLWQSGTALVAPLLGALTAGLTGAITGTAVAATFGAAVWWVLAHRSLGDR